MSYKVKLSLRASKLFVVSKKLGRLLGHLKEVKLTTYGAYLDVFFLFFPTVSGLKCFVGSGNSSAVLPMTEEEMMEHEKTQDEKKPEFKIMECGTRNSELISIDKMIKNVTDQIQEGLSGKIRVQRMKKIMSGT